MPLHAQWRKIADFPYPWGLDTLQEVVQVVYFLDLPGPPRIGFVGTTAAVYKTIDGGLSFTKVYDFGHYSMFGITDICFKDSLVGWFTLYDGSGSIADTACYRTTDGGSTWRPIEIRGCINGGNALSYNKLKGYLLLGFVDSVGLLSVDDGNHWKAVTTEGMGSVSFFNDSVEIAAGYTNNDSALWLAYVTINGGMNWDSVSVPSQNNFSKPLAIPGSSTCFVADGGRIIIRRSDDYGRTWRVLKDFGPPQDTTKPEHRIAPSGDGMIGGDLSRLYILTDSGMLVSMDQGVTWKLEKGSPAYASFTGNQIFYCAKGITIAGSTRDDLALFSGGGLWEEIWPQSGVSEEEPSSSGLRVFPNPAMGNISIESASGAVTIFDPLGRSYPLVVKGASFDVSSLAPGVYFVSDGHSRAKFVKE